MIDLPELGGRKRPVDWNNELQSTLPLPLRERVGGWGEGY